MQYRLKGESVFQTNETKGTIQNISDQDAEISYDANFVDSFILREWDRITFTEPLYLRARDKNSALIILNVLPDFFLNKNIAVEEVTQEVAKSFKSASITNNTINFYTTSDTTGTPAFTFDFPEEIFLDQAGTELVSNFVWSALIYPNSTNPNLNGKTVLVLAVKGDAETPTVKYSFVDVSKLVDVYTSADNTIAIDDNQIAVKVSAVANNAIAKMSDGLHVDISGKADKTELANYVTTETGKGLSTNDYTTTEKNKLAGIEDNAQANIIETVKVNNTALTPSNKAVNIDISNKIDKVTGATAGNFAKLNSDGTLANSTVSATTIDNKIDKVTGATGNVAKFNSDGSLADTTIPATNIVTKVTGATAGNIATLTSDGKIADSSVPANSVVTKKTSATSGNITTFTTGGDISDSGIAVTTIANKVDKVTGKGLSTNDYTTAEKNKLAGIAESANNYSLPDATSSTKGGVKIGSNISVSSGTISLTKDNVTNALGYTPPTTNTTYNVASTSADGLMSSSDKTKLNGIAENAQVNVIESVKVDGTALSVTDKAVNIDLSGKIDKVANVTAGNVATFYSDGTIADSRINERELALIEDITSVKNYFKNYFKNATYWIYDSESHIATEDYLYRNSNNHVQEISVPTNVSIATGNDTLTATTSRCSVAAFGENSGLRIAYDSTATIYGDNNYVSVNGSDSGNGYPIIVDGENNTIGLGQSGGWNHSIVILNGDNNLLTTNSQREYPKVFIYGDDNKISTYSGAAFGGYFTVDIFGNNTRINCGNGNRHHTIHGGARNTYIECEAQSGLYQSALYIVSYEDFELNHTNSTAYNGVITSVAGDVTLSGDSNANVTLNCDYSRQFDKRDLGGEWKVAGVDTTTFPFYRMEWDFENGFEHEKIDLDHYIYGFNQNKHVIWAGQDVTISHSVANGNTILHLAKDDEEEHNVILCGVTAGTIRYKVADNAETLYTIS